MIKRLKRYFEYHGPRELSEEEAKACHDRHGGYRVEFSRDGHSEVVLAVQGNMGVWLQLRDAFNRFVWSVSWASADKLSLSGFNYFSAVTYSCYPADVGGEKCLCRSFLSFKQDGERIARYVHVGTGRSELLHLERMKLVTLPVPAFGDYGDYMEFDYSEAGRLAWDWPASIVPAGQGPLESEAITAWLP